MVRRRDEQGRRGEVCVDGEVSDGVTKEGLV